MRGCLDVHVYEKYTLCILTITSINIIAVIQTYKNEYIYIYICVCVCVFILYIYTYIYLLTPPPRNTARCRDTATNPPTFKLARPKNNHPKPLSLRCTGTQSTNRNIHDPTMTTFTWNASADRSIHGPTMLTSDGTAAVDRGMPGPTMMTFCETPP